MIIKKNRELNMPALFFYFLLALFVNVSDVFAQDSSPKPYQEKQILILIGPQYGIPMLQAITPAIVNTLTENGFSLDDIFVEFLDLHRHQEAEHRSNILTLLETKLKDRSIGLIIAVNQGAVDFIASEGKKLLPGIPMLIPILERLPDWAGEPRKLITLTSRQDAEGTLGYALALFPETEQVLLIMGKDDHKAPFLDPISQAIDDLPKKLHVETTADLPYEVMLERVATLPQHTIAFYGSVFHDITGRSFVPAEVAGRVAETANRPVFAFRDMHIIQGLTGGSVTITSELGTLTAHIGIDYLAGNIGLSQPITAFDVPNVPLFDWQQLKRWGGNVDSLPATTIFLNRSPTLWSEHKEAVIVALASLILLSLLVVALLVANCRQRTAIRRREQAEKGLTESESLLSRSQEIAHIGSWSLDLTTNNLYWSDEVYRIFGCKPQEFAATYQAFLEFTHPDDRAAVDEAYSRSVSEGSDNYEIEHRILRQGTGKIRHVHERCVHDRDDTGAIIRSIGMVQDISELKQAEHLLKQQKKQLEQRNKALRQFNYAVSHELKTPLVSIESSLGLIQSSLPQTSDPELTTAFGYARHATRQMNNLLESLLLMFRIDAADTDTEATSFGLLVQDAIDQLTGRDKLKGIKVTIPVEGLELSGDRHKLVQIWLQLIENAAKYMGDQKDPAIAIGFAQTDQEVQFYVRDNGMGIEQPYQGKIFGLFDQLDKTAGGTGLGLTLVQRIVEYYGGTIRVESEALGKGSCFYFTLPDALINKGTTT